MRKRIETILLFVSVILLMMKFIYNVWNNLFAKENETKWIEPEREERRIQREEWLKDME